MPSTQSAGAHSARTTFWSRCAREQVVHREHVERRNEGREDQKQARREAGDLSACGWEAPDNEHVARCERRDEHERLEIEGPGVRIVHGRTLRYGPRGRSSMVEPQVSNLVTRVRFPPPASSDPVAKLLSDMKTAERERARKLRREQGASVTELARALGVSKSSISLWVRDIELTEAQRLALRHRMGGGIDGSRANAVRALARRREAQARGRAAARERDFLHAAGCMLFWAEGSRNRNVVCVHQLRSSDGRVLSSVSPIVLRSSRSEGASDLQPFCRSPGTSERDRAVLAGSPPTPR